MTSPCRFLASKPDSKLKQVYANRLLKSEGRHRKQEKKGLTTIVTIVSRKNLLNHSKIWDRHATGKSEARDDGVGNDAIRLSRKDHNDRKRYLFLEFPCGNSLPDDYPFPQGYRA